MTPSAFTAEHLRRALACRKRELEHGTPRQQREAPKAIRWIESELAERKETPHA